MSEIDQAKESMEKALKSLDHEFGTLRTGRPNASVLEDITVDYYGVPTPITQVAAIKVPDAHLMTIEPWDKSIVNAVEKAILASNLGITPNNDGSGTIRLPFPAPTEERRLEIVKECRSVAERARVSVRNARRDAKGKLERSQKDGDISEDELHRFEEQLQKLTDEYVAKVDEKLKVKEAEVMEI
jgi:ribosome recycling factor